MCVPVCARSQAAVTSVSLRLGSGSLPTLSFGSSLVYPSALGSHVKLRTGLLVSTEKEKVGFGWDCVKLSYGSI